MTSLQERFLESDGGPLRVGPYLVHMSIPVYLHKGTIHIQFLTEPDDKQGVRLSAVRGRGRKNERAGKVYLSDGTTTPRVSIWHQASLAPHASHRVETKEDSVLLYNIYRIYHPKMDLTTEDHSTGEAGMVVLEEGENWSRIGCSDWRAPFDPTNLVFRLEWEIEEA